MKKVKFFLTFVFTLSMTVNAKAVDSKANCDFTYSEKAIVSLSELLQTEKNAASQLKNSHDSSKTWAWISSGASAVGSVALIRVIGGVFMSEAGFFEVILGRTAVPFMLPAAALNKIFGGGSVVAWAGIPLGLLTGTLLNPELIWLGNTLYEVKISNKESYTVDMKSFPPAAEYYWENYLKLKQQSDKKIQAHVGFMDLALSGNWLQKRYFEELSAIADVKVGLINNLVLLKQSELTIKKMICQKN